MTRTHKRDLKRQIENLTTDGDKAGLITILSTLQHGGEVTRIPGQPHTIRVDGDVRELTENAREKLREP